jgi:hypothetical protein
MFTFTSFISKWNSQRDATRIATSSAFALALAVILAGALQAALGPFKPLLEKWPGPSEQAVKFAVVTLAFMALSQCLNAAFIAAVRSSRLKQANTSVLRLVHAIGSDMLCVALMIAVTVLLMKDVRFDALICGSIGVAVGFAALGVLGLGMGGVALFIKGDPDKVENPVLKLAILKLLPAVAIVLLEASPATIAVFIGMVLLDVMVCPIGKNFSMRED